jgi:small acid-soluble spore protein (thioredoxin-like protein)
MRHMERLFLLNKGGIKMPRPLPNDSADNVDRLKKTISNMEAANEAAKTAEGAELASIKEKNERRKEAIEGIQEEIHQENKSRINGYS